MIGNRPITMLTMTAPDDPVQGSTRDRLLVAGPAPLRGAGLPVHDRRRHRAGGGSPAAPGGAVQALRQQAGAARGRRPAAHGRRRRGRSPCGRCAGRRPWGRWLGCWVTGCSVSSTPNTTWCGCSNRTAIVSPSLRDARSGRDQRRRLSGRRRAPRSLARRPRRRRGPRRRRRGPAGPADQPSTIGLDLRRRAARPR